MKEIYVVHSTLFGQWKSISKEEADELFNNDEAYGVEFTAQWMNAKSMKFEPVKIMLLAQTLISSTYYSEEDAIRLAEDYVTYVESITGMIIDREKEES